MNYYEANYVNKWNKLLSFSIIIIMNKLLLSFSLVLFVLVVHRFDNILITNERNSQRCNKRNDNLLVFFIAYLSILSTWIWWCFSFMVFSLEIISMPLAAGSLQNMRFQNNIECLLIDLLLVLYVLYSTIAPIIIRWNKYFIIINNGHPARKYPMDLFFCPVRLFARPTVLS